MEYLNIRELTKDDIDLMVDIAVTHSDGSEQLDRIRTQFQKELSELGSNRYIYGAFIEDKSVAMIQLVLKNADNDPDQADGNTIASAHNLQVDKSFQGQGIGTKMMSFIEDQARKLGKKILTLGVDDINLRAIELYSRLGYKHFKTGEGRVPEEFCLIMKKQL